MQCCVKFCENSSETVQKGISFHDFPSDMHLRAAWLKALCIQDTDLPDAAVVCSQHFLNDDIYVTQSGYRQIAAGAIPSTVQVCMMCLEIDCKLFEINKYKLDTAYEMLTGHPMCDLGNLKQTVCVQCAQRLIDFSRFRDKSLKVRALMIEMVKRHQFITKLVIETITHSKTELRSNLVVSKLEPDHYDLCIQEDNDKQTDIVVKNEENYDAMLVDDDMEMTNDFENHEFVRCKNEHLSDNTNVLEIKTLKDDLCLEKKRVLSAHMDKSLDSFKYENAPYQCNLCSKAYVQEHTFLRHMRTHIQKGDSDGDMSQECGSHTATTNKNRQAKSKVNENHHVSTNIVTLSGTPVISRQAMSNENNVQAEKEAAIISKKSKQVKKTKKSHSCESCDYRTTNSRSLAKHTRTHAGQKPFSCTFCSYTCAKKSYLVTHVRTHTGETPFSCNFCEFKTARKVRLEVHVMRTHTGEKPYLCDICAYKTIKKMNLVNHMRVHTGEKPFSCKLCDYKCARDANLVYHMRIHNNTYFSCKLCKYKCTQKCRLETHMRTHTGVKPFTCKLCDYKSTQHSNLVRHQRKHTGERPYACKFCENKYSQNSHLLKHIKTHSSSIDNSFLTANLSTNNENNMQVEETYKIESSTQVKNFNPSQVITKDITNIYKLTNCFVKLYDIFKKPEFIQDDVSEVYNAKTITFSANQSKIDNASKDLNFQQNVNETIGLVIDEKCASNMHVSKNLQNMTNCSNIEKESHSLLIEKNCFTCDICKKSFARKFVLINHIKNHSDLKQFICEYCPFRSKYKGNLVIHIKTHTGEKTFACKLCDYKFVTNSVLKKHMQVHTGDKNFHCKICNLSVYKKNRIAHMRTHTGEKPFSCQFCDFRTAYKSYLTCHVRNHMGYKPISCNLCDYKCVGNNYLKKHMRVHLGVKPYYCKFCSYKCSNNSDLVKHIRTHTGDKPFSCELCEFKTAQSSQLSMHMKRHSLT